MNEMQSFLFCTFLLIPAIISAKELSLEKMSHDIAYISAQEAISEGKIKLIRLPKTSNEEGELDTRCSEGPRSFFSWMFPTENDTTAKTSISWDNYGAIAKNPLFYCHEQIKAYRAAMDGTLKSPDK